MATSSDCGSQNGSREAPKYEALKTNRHACHPWSVFGLVFSIYLPGFFLRRIIRAMARGWESKSVEAQIESAEGNGNSVPGEQLTPQQIKRQWEKEGLLRSRARVLHDLENCQNPRYREMLSAALADLDEKLSSLN